MAFDDFGQYELWATLNTEIFWPIGSWTCCGG